MSRARRPKRAVRLAPGQEQYAVFQGDGKAVIQYEYGLPDGTLFTCQARTLAAARARRDVVLHLLEADAGEGAR